MHVHKAYPFHPTYWATECQFWPGFVPWKLKVHMKPNSTPDWNIITSEFNFTTDAGDLVADATQIFWRLQIPTVLGALDMTVSLEQIKRDNKLWARWKAQVFDGFILEASAWLYLPSPQRVVTTYNKNWNTVDEIGEQPPTIEIDCAPATFADGGSPFPNY